MRRGDEEDHEDDGLLSVSRNEAERLARASYDAMFGPGSYDSLDFVKRDDSIKEVMEVADRLGLGSVPW